MRQIYQDKKIRSRHQQKHSTTKVTLLSIKIFLLKKCIELALFFNKTITLEYSSILFNKIEQNTKQETVSNSNQ